MFELLLAAAVLAAQAEPEPAAPAEVAQSREAILEQNAPAEQALARFLAATAEKDGLDAVSDAYRELLRRMQALEESANEHTELVNSYRYTKGLQLLSPAAGRDAAQIGATFAWARKEDVFLEQQAAFRYGLLEKSGPHLIAQEKAHAAARRRRRLLFRISAGAAIAGALAAAAALALRWARG